MNKHEELREEVEFWLDYINYWQENKQEPVPDKALQLLENALIKLIVNNRINMDQNDQPNNQTH